MDKQELLRIIAQAADEEWTMLNLSNQELTELPSEIGMLTNLRELYLSHNHLSILPSEIGELTNLKILYLDFNPLINLPPEFENLINLTKLMIRRTPMSTFPPEILKLINLERFHITDSQLTAFPQEINQLTKLISLEFAGNQFTIFPIEICQLTNLQILQGASNQLDTIPREIRELTNLTDLLFRANHIVNLPDEIGHLSNLLTLELEDNKLCELPQTISKLTKLKRLDLRGNPLPIPYEILELREPSDIITYYFQNYDDQKKEFLNKITNSHDVDSLNLSNRKLTTFPTDICKLGNLRRLNLQYNSISTIPSEIGHLRNLRELRLGDNQLINLPKELFELPNLVTLAIHGNNLMELPQEICQLTNLRNLWIQSNQFSTLPSKIGELTNLIRLDISRNQLTSLPIEIGKLRNLTEISLSANKLTILPQEILKLTNLEHLDLRGNPLPIPPEILELRNQPQKILNYYFQLQAQQKKPLHEAKVLIVGQGAVGKTSLIKRLLEDTFNPHEIKTDGIAIKQWYIPVPSTAHSTSSGQDSGRVDEIRLNIWDFGGQEIMHATHQFFLTKRSLYLLVLDSRLDEKENRVEYWLKIIQSFGGDSPVIVVCNKNDQHDLELDWRGLQTKYPAIKAFARNVSCKTGEGIADLKGLIAQETGQLPHIHDELVLPWFSVKTKLEEMRADYIAYSDYQQMCAQEQVTDDLSQQTLLGFLHDLGIVLHFHDHPLLEDTNVLNPEWVTRGVYQLLNSNELFQCKGALDRPMLDRILDPQAYPRQKHQFIIDMMRKFELCFDFAEFPNERFLVPDLLAKEEPDTGDWNDSLAFQYHYDILPGSVISRFMVRMHTYISKHTYWRNGVVLASEDGKNRALVKADSEDRKIFIYVTGRTETRHLFLEIIRADFRKIHATIPKLVVKEKVPIPGYPQVVVDYEHLLTLDELGEESFIPEGLKIKVKVQDLLRGISGSAGVAPAMEAERMSAYSEPVTFDRRKRDELQQRWDLVSQKLAHLERERILETKAEERFRLEQSIALLQTERQQLEQQLQTLES